MNSLPDHLRDNFDSLQHLVFFLELAQSNGDMCAADYYRKGSYQLNQSSIKTKEFEERGYIKRELDGRKKYIYLDEKGKDLLDQIRQQTGKILEEAE